MNEDIKKILQKSVRTLKANGGMDNKELKPVIASIEKLIKRRTNKKLKRA